MPTSERSGEGGRRDQRRPTVSLSRTTTTRTTIDTTTIAESEKNDDGGESGSGSGSSGVLFMAGALSGIAEAIVVQPFDMVKTPTSDNPGTNPGVYRTLLQLHHEGGGGTIVVSRIRTGSYGDGAEIFGHVWARTAQFASTSCRRRICRNRRERELQRVAESSWQ